MPQTKVTPLVEGSSPQNISTSTAAVAPASRRSSRRSPVQLAILGVTAVVLGGAGVWAGQRVSAAAAQAADMTHIARGVTIARVPVGGMTRDEAEQKVKAWAREKSDNLVTLQAPISKQKWNLKVADAGGRYDIAPALDKALKIGKDEGLWQKLWYGEQERPVNLEPDFKFNPAVLTKHVEKIATRVDRAPVNARARITEDGQMTLSSSEKKGVKLDVKATVAGVTAKGLDTIKDGVTAPLVIREKYPAVSAADLGKMGTLLGSFTSDYSTSTRERARNVELASGFINGTILAPGEVFSYNKVVGPRTADRGWQNALMFEDGEVVPGMGGGVCQPSSTLYNAVLTSGLEVVTRSNHSIRVKYVPIGRDATVVFGAIDFKFRNSTGGPIAVLSKARGRRLTFSIYGQAPEKPRRYEIVSGPVTGNRLGGLSVSTYRITHEPDGTSHRERLSTDAYRPPAS